MIPQPWIEAWRAQAPWASASLVEQDLVLSRAIVAIYQVPELASALAFRGGTAIHKLHRLPGSRYSEDIDLVQEEPQRPLRLKIEINSREHAAVLGHVRLPLEVRSDWFTGSAELTTFDLDELMGTKLRALFEQNLHEKAVRDVFRGDMAPLLRPGLAWDADAALAQVLKELVERLPGEPWAGEVER